MVDADDRQVTSGQALSRLDNIADDGDGTTKYAQYTYLGVGSIVKAAHPGVTGGLDLTYGTGGSYGGFDRFGCGDRTTGKKAERCPNPT